MLKDDIQREDRSAITVGTIVEFEPFTYNSSVGPFNVARNIRITPKKERPITIYKKRTLKPKK